MSQPTLPHQAHSDAQLALAMLVRHVQRIASDQAARIALGEVTPQQACSAVVRQGASSLLPPSTSALMTSQL